jgi:LmbE family N-acetylglucosaminyl deacetylase
MKILVVAHPDDEILWFNPEELDKIYIVFLGRDGRAAALNEHPLKHKIECFNFPESNYWRDKTKKVEYDKNYSDLIAKLKEIDATEVRTHNAYGEYGHLDHILCFNACMEVFNCPVNGKNPKLYREIKNIYQKKQCWTWF